MNLSPVYSVIVPVYNCAESLFELNESLQKTMISTGKSFEIVYVDDCSLDDSWKTLVSMYKNSDNSVHIIRLAKNVGQWMALICGVANSRGSHIITIDDDLEYNPADIHLLLNHYHENDLAIVYGIPKGKSQKNLSNRLFFRIRSNLLDWFLGKQKTESFRVFNRRIIIDRSGQPYSGLHFEAQAKHGVSQKRVGYVTVGYRKRPHGNSGYSLMKKIKLILRFGPEHLVSPFRYWIIGSLLLIFLLPLPVIAVLTGQPELMKLHHVVLTVFSAFSLLGIGLLGSYLVKVFFILKGLPDYIIIEEM